MSVAASHGAGRDGIPGMGEQVTIRPATTGEVAALPGMQVDAGQVFRDLGMAMVADGPEPEVAEFARAQQRGHLLVALVGTDIIGFVRLEVLDGALHIEQVNGRPRVWGPRHGQAAHGGCRGPRP